MGNMGSGGGGCGCGDKKPATPGQTKTGSCATPNAQPKTGQMGANNPNTNAAKK
ncbi:MAG: hypothetical protein J0M12_14725 [Deltaproteobacteria bacterium]|nr:hypothetical protein [Deltaproteobacteria bacterium]